MSALKEHGAATVDELKDFLQGMKGKSAQEVLGVIAQSGLVRAVTQATVATLVLVAVFTVGPYMLYGRNGAKPAAASGDNAKQNTDSQAATSPNAAAASNTSAAAGASGAGTPAVEGASSPTGGATTPAGAPADLERAAQVLGVGETKGADPKSNPREKDLDSLLDKIK